VTLSHQDKYLPEFSQVSGSLVDIEAGIALFCTLVALCIVCLLFLLVACCYPEPVYLGRKKLLSRSAFYCLSPHLKVSGIIKQFSDISVGVRNLFEIRNIKH